LGGNCLGQTPAELTEEFLLLQALRPALKKPVVHLIGALATGESMTDAEMYELAIQLLDAQGYSKSLTSIWRHLDGSTHHFHIITSQIDLDGNAINQSFERFRMKRSCRSLEKKFGLKVVPNVHDHEKPLPPVPAIENDGLDVELPSVTTIVREAFSEAIRATLPGCETFSDLARGLHEKGMVMVPQIHSETGQLYGLGFRMETGPLAGSYITGSKIPGNFSPAKLVAKHGLTFDSVRDLPILSNPIPKPPAPSPVHLKPTKPRRKKKGERHNARNQRTPSRLKPILPGPCPWISSGASFESIHPRGPSSEGSRLVRSILASTYQGTAPTKPAHESLFPRTGGNPWGMASRN
jgi:hypothetical protein